MRPAADENRGTRASGQPACFAQFGEGHVTNELVGSRPFDPLAMVSAWSVLPCLGFVHPGHQRGGRYE